MKLQDCIYFNLIHNLCNMLYKMMNFHLNNLSMEMHNFKHILLHQDKTHIRMLCINFKIDMLDIHLRKLNSSLNYRRTLKYKISILKDQ